MQDWYHGLSHSRGMGWNSPNQTNKFSVPVFSKQSVSASNVELPKGHNDSELQGWGFRLALLLVVMGAVAAHYVGRDIQDQQVLTLINH